MRRKASLPYWACLTNHEAHEPFRIKPRQRPYPIAAVVAYRAVRGLVILDSEMGVAADRRTPIVMAQYVEQT